VRVVSTLIIALLSERESIMRVNLTGVLRVHLRVLRVLR
jgi:hypothetical protein